MPRTSVAYGFPELFPWERLLLQEGRERRRRKKRIIFQFLPVMFK